MSWGGRGGIISFKRTIFLFLQRKHALPVNEIVKSSSVAEVVVNRTSLKSSAGTGCSCPFLGHYEFSRSRIVQRKS